MAKVNRTFIYLGVAVLGVAGWILTEPEPPVESDNTTSTKRSSSPTSKDKDTVFNKEDEQASFARLETAPGNAFQPLVSRKDGKKKASNLLPNQIPPYFTDGDATWFFTGSVVVDQIPSVLIESAARNEGVYLQVGERFKQFSVRAITPSTVTLVGPDGASANLVLIENRPIVDLGTSASLAPLDPLTGPININATPPEQSETTDTVAKVEEESLPEVKKATKSKIALKTDPSTEDKKDTTEEPEIPNK